MPELQVSDLSVAEFRALLREALEEALLETFGDPDAGMELTDAIKNSRVNRLKRNTIHAEQTALDSFETRPDKLW